MRIIQSPSEMRDFGIAFSKSLKAGDLIVLTGPLGAGKTALTQGIGAGLGISGITSPTFVIAKTYSGSIPLIHVDAYRLLDSNIRNFEFDDLDLDTSRDKAVTVIEWGGDIAARLAGDYLMIEIGFGEGENQRTITAHNVGSRWAGFVI